jgi:lipoprotein-anchoring transpeptidase ErfK/SrfK
MSARVEAGCGGPSPQPGRQRPSMSQMSQPKVPAWRLAALPAVLLAAALALAGCARSGSRDPGAPSAAPSAAAEPAAPQPGRVRLGDAAAYVAVATTDLAAHAKPRTDSRVLGLFPRTTPWGNPTPFLVTQAYRDAAGERWLEVLLPRRPNESVGWIRGEQVRLRPVAHALEVDLSARTVRLLRNGRTVRGWPVGIGRPATPTPTGRFYITVKLRPPQISAVYGARALGLSGYSEVLEQFGTGDGQIALHGTANPSDLGNQVSNGCLRLDNQTITTLAETLPLGTPVTIRA